MKVFHGCSYATVSGIVSPEGVSSVWAGYAISRYDINNIHDDTLFEVQCKHILIDNHGFADLDNLVGIIRF